MLYGTAQHGGPYGDDGVMFSVDTNGSGYKELFDFRGKDGSLPGEALTLSGNVLYGVTQDSGSHYYGVIFSYKDTNGGLGVNELKVKNENVKVYPNPNNGNFTLEYDLGKNGNGYVELYNALGQMVGEYKLTNSQGKMNISNPQLSNGVYLWRLYNNNQPLKYGKVVIMR